MQVVCVGEVTQGHEIKVADHIKRKLMPGDKLKIKIESIDENKEEKRLNAIERIKKMGRTSKLGLYNEVVGRDDAHDREAAPQ